MKFFIPAAESLESEQRVYEAIKLHLPMSSFLPEKSAIYQVET